MQYKKPPLTHAKQIELLTSRGLKIKNVSDVIFYLKNINYYRLSAYFLPFKSGKNFKDNVSFEEVINLYSFDRKLRLLILEAIEPIEIAIRTKIIYQLSHAYGAFGYLDPKNFSNRFMHAEWLSHLEQLTRESKETFIQHYKDKYTSSRHMPIWMILELVSFGGLSRIFQGLHGADQQAIAKQFGLPDTILISWLHVLAYLRNLCAHHSRLWNRALTFKPKLPRRPDWQNFQNTRVYCLLTIIQYLICCDSITKIGVAMCRKLKCYFFNCPYTRASFRSNSLRFVMQFLLHFLYYVLKI